MHRIWIGVGGVLGALAVAAAAAAAHALAGVAPAGVRAVQSGVQMQGWHALALVGCGLWAERRTGLARRVASLAGAAFLLGTILFCTAVYVFGLTGDSLDGMAPAGGVLLMLGWLLLAASAVPRP